MAEPQWCMDRPYRLDIRLDVEQQTPAEGSYIPVRLPAFDLTPLPGRQICIDSLAIVGYDASGAPLIFDDDKQGQEALAIPFRFEPDYEGYALPAAPRKGDLIFLGSCRPERQFYSLYFDMDDDDREEDRLFPVPYGGLVGDGDIFVQKRGNLAVPGYSRPTYCGRELFGRQGLLVAAGYATGIYFFEDAAPDNPLSTEYVNRGRIKDAAGNVIWGIPAVGDIDGDGRLDLVVGRQDGTILCYRNGGSNEQPLFAVSEPLLEADGTPIDLKKYLQGRQTKVELADGTISKRYSQMSLVAVHGGETHIYVTPHFVDWSGDNLDLLVGTKGGFLLYFEHTDSGYRKGVFVKDENGADFSFPIVAFPASLQIQEKCHIIIGGYHSPPAIFTLGGFEDGRPVLCSLGNLDVRSDAEYPFPLAVTGQDGLSLYVGNSYGEVKRFRGSGLDETGKPLFDEGCFLQSKEAWITRMMPQAHYLDMDEDGRRDLLSGDIKGGIFLYRNLGTDKNPLFSRFRRLADENGPIKIESGPDPLTPDDGYSKPIAFDISGSGRNDLLVGSGLGRIFHYRNLGLDADGFPHFTNQGVLRDSEGREIICHHMSAAAIADWDSDGTPDLIVSGQRNVHALQDDDPDVISQVRFFRGRRRDRALLFDPYIPFEAEGDRTFAYRPIPPVVGTWQGTKALFIGGGMIFRRSSASSPEQVEFVRWFIPSAARPDAGIIPAYFSFASLGDEDPLVVLGSCVGAVYAFRKTFAVNRGYLKASILWNSLQSSDMRTRRTLAIRQTTWEEVMPVEYHISKRYDVSFAEELPSLEKGMDICQGRFARNDFTDKKGNAIPFEKSPSVAVIRTPSHLVVRIAVPEANMEDAIADVEHNNGPLDHNEHISILLDPGRSQGSYYCWQINSAGYYKEFMVDRDTEEAIGPWHTGYEDVVNIEKSRTKNGYCLQLAIPFCKLGVIPEKGTCWFFDIRRHKNLYADKTSGLRALEQRFTDIFYWGGGGMGRVALYFHDQGFSAGAS